MGEFLAPGVGDLDAQDVADDVEGEPEIATGDASVVRRVVGQLGDEEACRVQGQAPGTQLLGREQTGEAGTAWRGGELHAEIADGRAEFGGGFLIHVTQRGGLCVP
ncbi:hypothetical protein RKD32_004398 [Streptomyces sp. SAI-195]